VPSGDACGLQNKFSELGSSILNSSKQIIDAAMKNLFISRKLLCDVSGGGILEFTVTIEANLNTLTNSYGHGRFVVVYIHLPSNNVRKNQKFLTKVSLHTALL
jgi:hypothetical protein